MLPSVCEGENVFTYCIVQNRQYVFLCVVQFVCKLSVLVAGVPCSHTT
jgi:hypothetical protein